jgi:hypothetical protein
VAIDGAVSSGGEWGEGKWKGGEDGAALPFRVEWRGVGGESVAGGEYGGGASAGGRWRPRLLDARRKRVKGAGRLGPKARNNWDDVEKSNWKRTGCQNHLG